MFIDRIVTALSEISAKMDVFIETQKTRAPETDGQAEDKLGEKEMQEAITNLMSYDPFKKKRSDE